MLIVSFSHFCPFCRGSDTEMKIMSFSMQSILGISSFLVTQIHLLLPKKIDIMSFFNARYFGISSFLVTKIHLLLLSLR